MVWDQVADSPSSPFVLSRRDLSSLLEETGLTPHELEVLEWVARGKTNSQIGVILEISPSTAAKHLQHIYTKFRVRSRTEAVVHFFGMIQPNLQVRVTDLTDTAD